MHAYRSHTCADLNVSHVGQTVRLCGWVHRVRDHGGVLFIDLRDHYGVTQVIADADSPVFSQVEELRSEWCIRIDGNVLARDESLINPKLPTGEVEVFIKQTNYGMSVSRVAASCSIDFLFHEFHECKSNMK